MKKILFILGLLIFGNICFATQTTIDLPKDEIIIQRKKEITKETEIETKQQKTNEKFKKFLKEMNNKTPSPNNKAIQKKEKSPAYSNGIIIYKHDDKKTKPQKPTPTKKESCKTDPKSPCNAYKAMPARVRVPHPAQVKKPRKKYPARPRKLCL